MELYRAAYNVVTNCLGIKEEEEVVVVTDERRRKIAEALCNVAAAVGGVPSIIEILPTGRHGAEPPAAVSAAMAEADVFVAPTSYSLSHTDARRRATENGARGATMPMITEDIFVRTLSVDYNLVRDRTEKVAGLLSSASEIRVKTPSGTDVVFDVSGRKAMADTGIYVNPGEWGNLPAGEACMAPVSADGVVVVDFWHGRRKENRIVVENGRAVEIEGVPELNRILSSVGECAFTVAELGLGTNPGATLSGNVLEDEKVDGTVHVAFGDNTSYDGGTNKCPVHEDVVLVSPTVEVDGETVIRGGKWLL